MWFDILVMDVIFHALLIIIVLPHGLNVCIKLVLCFVRTLPTICTYPFPGILGSGAWQYDWQICYLIAPSRSSNGLIADSCVIFLKSTSHGPKTQSLCLLLEEYFQWLLGLILASSLWRALSVALMPNLVFLQIIGLADLSTYFVISIEWQLVLSLHSIMHISPAHLVSSSNLISSQHQCPLSISVGVCIFSRSLTGVIHT